MGKKILSSDGQSIFAVAISEKTIEIKRGDQLFTVTGNDFTIIGTPAKGRKATVISVRDSKIDEANVAYVEDDQLDEEGNPKPADAPKDNPADTQVPEEK